MCTGAEPALIAAAAAEAAPAAAAATTAATAAGAGATAATTAAGATAAEAGLGALLSGSTAIAPEAIAASVPELAATAAPEIVAPAVADGAGATLAAADMTPATLAAADTAAASAPIASTVGPAQGAVLNPGIQASGAEVLPVAQAAPVQGAQSTFLGMTPTQWTQQLITQGGSAALQAIGAAQSQGEMQDVADAYDQTVSEYEKAQLAAVDEGLAGFSSDALAANQGKYQDEMLQTFDQNAPTRASFGTLLLDSAPAEVKADYAKKQKASSDYARGQFQKSTALTSLGRAMTAGAQKMQDAMSRLNMNKYVLDGATGSLNNSMQQAGQAGSIYSGLGSLTSSLGNALLASQNSSGNRPKSVTDIY